MLVFKSRAQQQLSALSESLNVSGARIRELDHDTLSWQMRLACIAAPTGAESERAAVMARELAAAGCTTQVDAVGNVIAETSSAHTDARLAPVVCLAHLDTVFDADTLLAPVQLGARVSCPGIGDNGRGLATMLTLARIMYENKLRESRPVRRVVFVGTVGEEGLGNLRGALAYFSNRRDAGLPDPHSVMVLDGPGDENIVHHALGSRRYRVAFRGRGGHSWADFGAPNAVHAASRAAAWLADVPRNLHGRVALTVSGIGGGESMNAIPANAFIDIDVRATDQTLLTRVDAELNQIVRAALEAETNNAPGASRARAKLANANAAFRSDITLLGERPCGVLPREHELVQLAEVASRWHNVEPVSAIASTDANIPLSMGIPAITIGGGGTGGGAHTLHEWYDNSNGPRGVARAFAILAALTA